MLDDLVLSTEKWFLLNDMTFYNRWLKRVKGVKEPLNSKFFMDNWWKPEVLLPKIDLGDNVLLWCEEADVRQRLEKLYTNTGV